MAGKEPKPTPFEIALAAKRGKIPQETLRGAAKMLFRNHTEAELVDYTKPSTPHIGKVINRQSTPRNARSV